MTRAKCKYPLQLLLIRLIASFCLLTVFVSGKFAYGQTYTNILSFSGTAAPNYGSTSWQLSLVQAPDGFFYGTTRSGGTAGKGVVYKVSSTGAYTLLHTFTATAASTTDGASAYGSLCLGADGNLYGTTYAGGANNLGIFYQIKTDGTFALLHSFAATEGANPFAGVVEGSDGNFYGTLTAQASGFGSVYQITPTGTLTVLHTFTGQPDAATSRGSLLQGADGAFYGTTNAGGANNNGSIFKVTANKAYTLLYSFTNGSDGAAPQGPLVQAQDGNFYGASLSGASSYGYFYQVTPSGTFTPLHAFTVAEGYNLLQGYLLAPDGNLYTTAISGGPSYGAIQRITLGGTNANLYSFKATAADGATPRALLLQGADGAMYGTTYATTGPATGSGSVFQFQPNATAMLAEITYTVPATIYTGNSFTLGYAVFNAYSQTFQRCLATNNAGDTTGWVGIKAGAPTTTSATLTAPATPGTYRYTLTCGGTESGYVNITAVTAQRPMVSGLTPSSGPAAGGTSVSIAGSGFSAATTAVKFGSTAATSFTVTSDTSIIAVSPAGTGGTAVDVTVTTAGGTSAASIADRFTYQSAQQAQTINFTQPSTPTFVGSTATLSATASSGLPVTFSIASGAAYAMLSGTNNSTITYTAPRTVVIAADQAGNASYLAATQVTRTVTIQSQSVFIVNSGGSVVSKYDNGTGQSAATAGGGIGAALGVEGQFFSIAANGTGLTAFESNGASSNTATGSTLTGGKALAVDGNGYIWIVNADGKVAKFYYLGQVYPIGVAAAGNISGATGILVDTAGSLWISNGSNNTVTEIIGAAASVATPIVTQVITGQPGNRP